MTISNTIKTLLMMLAILGTATTTFAGLYEKGGALGNGAKAMGMAGAFTALAQDESALFWNPAGLGDVTNNRIASSLESVYDGKIRNLIIAAAMPLPKGVVSGLSWQHSFYPQHSEVNADELLLAGSIPLTQDKQLWLGLGLKLLFGHTVETERTYSGMGLDIGFRYKLKLNERYRLRFGFHWQDIDTRINWQDDQLEQLPTRLALGVGLLIDQRTKIGLDLETIHSGQEEAEETRIVRLGVEHWFGNLIGIRGGYILDNHQVSSFSLGAGIEVAQIQIEYALSSQVANLGLSHRLSLSYGLPLFKFNQKPDQSEEALFIPKLDPEVYQFELVALPIGFSPNGDGLADTVILQLDMHQGSGQDVDNWKLVITDQQGIEQRSFKGLGYPEQMEWDGADKTAKICEDGFYKLEMTVYNKEGKVLGQVQVNVQIKTDFLPIDMELNSNYLIRINGKITPPLKIVYAGSRDEAQKNWEVLIQNKTGLDIKRFTGAGTIPNELIWDGTVKGKPVADGRYQVILIVSDAMGLRKEVNDYFQIKSIAPKVNISVSPRVIRPGQKKDGQAIFTVKTSYNQNIQKWKLELTDKVNQKLVRTIVGQESVPEKITWDGRDNENKLVPGGRYLEAQLKLTYINGMQVVSSIKTLATDLSVSTTSRALALHLTAINFEPGSSVIPLDSYKQLNQAADTIRQYAKNYRVHVKGHTDDQESSKQKLELSWERVLRVKEYLNVSGKIPITTIDGIGYGDRLPIAPITSAAGRAKNRRVEIVLIIEDNKK